MPFIAFLGVILLFIGATVNLGQVALVRTETSNAADAGALAGASWMASGNNEAALIANKMWTAIALAQAIYIVPFCRRTQARNFARLVLRNLVVFNQYLQFVANDRILMGAWNLGRRETFVASANNLMVRYRTGQGLLGPITDDVAMDEQTNELEERMAFSAQLWERDYNHLVDVLTWDNGLMAPGGQQHTARFRAFEYPQAPATLQTTNWSGAVPGFGYVWTPCINVGQPGHPYFPCCHRNVSIGYQNGPVTPTNAEVTFRFRRQLSNVNVRQGGAVVAGRKLWDVDLNGVIPNPASATIGSCGNVCTLQTLSQWDPGTFFPRRIAPRNISGGTGNVRMRVTHEVQAWAGSTDAPQWNIPLPPGFRWPDQLHQWSPLLPTVASESRAQYTAPDVGRFDVIPDGRAQVTGAQ